MNRLLFLLPILALSVSFSQEPLSTPDITAQELRQHIKYLASDELAGRKTGERGNRQAAEYIAKEFERYGLKPAGTNGTFFQEFPFLASVKEGTQTQLAFHILEKDFTYTLDDGFNLQSVSTD